MLQNPRKTLGFKNNMIYIISPARGGGGKPCLSVICQNKSNQINILIKI